MFPVLKNQQIFIRDEITDTEIMGTCHHVVVKLTNINSFLSEKSFEIGPEPIMQTKQIELVQNTHPSSIPSYVVESDGLG